MASEWHSIEALKEAFERTKQLLLKKFNLVFWLKLAVVVFLISGIGFNPSSSYSSGGGVRTLKQTSQEYCQYW